MARLQKILKLYGRMKTGDVMWIWDYANDKSIKESEMTKEMMAASERAKWAQIAKQLTNKTDNK